MTTASPLDGVGLVALDLDGTLLPGSKRLTPRAVALVRTLRDAGIQVTLATGKGWNLTRRYAAELGLDAPVVALEGALVCHRDRGEPLHSALLAADAAVRIHQAVSPSPLAYFYCHDGWRMRAERSLAQFLDELHVWDPHVDLTDLPPGGGDVPDGTPFHYNLVGTLADVARAEGSVRALELPGVTCFRADYWRGLHLLQVRPEGVGKETGLRHVLDHLDLSPADLLACGDWVNDLEMMRLARVAVAPSNAVPQVRALATHVAPGTCEDDGVVAFLETALAAL